MLDEQIKVDRSKIPFSTVKFHFGQKVLVARNPGYVIGLSRHNYGWSYLVVDGENPNNDSGEEWYYEQDLAPTEA